ncbi:hypothetical protein GQ600_16811 [Phytophthora cactorum]|nr:hypothetical protein GQ600_16811 [Phytophthora cactorum]
MKGQVGDVIHTKKIAFRHGALLWLLLLFVGFVAALASSAKLRKNAFIWFSYVTITGWYYCRVLHKKYAGNNDNNKEASGAEGRRDPDLVYFEPREVVERRQHAERMDWSACNPSKRKRSFFHSRRKAAAEEAMRRVSDASSADLLTNSARVRFQRSRHSHAQQRH